MTKSELRDVLLIEAHRILAEEAKRAVQKIGKPIPAEARPVIGPTKTLRS